MSRFVPRKLVAWGKGSPGGLDSLSTEAPAMAYTGRWLD
jgi:hypothetical protein